MTSVVFMGTPEAAVPSLKLLAGRFDVSAVVTRPDRPAGRRRHLRPPPVKEAAIDLGLPVFQPTNRTELVDLFGSLRPPDVGVVVAFGMILPSVVLDQPGHGFLNLHFSRLPRWRGAAPVERAVMAGDTETAATVMVMDAGLDTGPILAERVLAIGPHETGGAVTRRLADDGAHLLAETVPAWIDGTISPSPQPDHGITYAERIGPSDRLVVTNLSVREIVDRVRALAPSPGAQMMVDGEPHKILEVGPAEEVLSPGEWSSLDGAPLVGVADGSMQITRIQPPGKKPMTGEEWLRGRRHLPSSPP